MPDNPFNQMVDALRVRSPSPFVIPAPALGPAAAELSKSEQLRQLIKARGPISPLSLAVQIDLEGGAGLVRALLKGDFDAHRVIVVDGKYTWNPEYDAKLEEQLRAALRLLRRHGYQVKRPPDGQQWQKRGHAHG